MVKLENPIEPVSTGRTRHEKAERALSAFYRVKPQLEAFARVFTGDKSIYIVPTGGASYATVDPRSGKQHIGMKVNLDLGAEYRHDPQVCDKRDAVGQLKCPACVVRENMLVPLFHEIGHIAYDSFEAMSERDKYDAMREAIKEAKRWGVKGRRLERIEKRWNESMPSTFVEAAARISPFLHPILNSLEDARVNELTMQARPGMRVMFSSRAQRIFTAGIEQEDGSFSMWSEAPENAQVIIGLFCLASGYDFDGWFVPEVEEALRDEKLVELTIGAAKAHTAGQLYRLGFPILERLRELGFCKTSEDEEPEPGPAPMEGGDESDDESGDGEAADAEATGEGGGDPADGDNDESASGSGSGDDDAASDEGDDEAAGGDDDDDASDEGAGSGEDASDASDEGGGSGGEPGGDSKGSPEDVARILSVFGDHDDDAKDDYAEYEDRKDAEAVERAIVQAEHFDEPSVNISYVEMPDPFSGQEKGMVEPEDLDRFRPQWRTAPIDPADIQKSLGKMRIAFSENKKGSKERGLKSGRVSARALSRVPLGEEKVFQKRKRPGKRDYHVVLGLDLSGSTSMGRLSHLKAAAFAQAELLDRLGVSFEVWGHSGYPSTRSRGDGITLLMVPVKSKSQRWDEAARRRLNGLTPVYMNLDGHSMEFYRKRLDESRATDRILMYYTDGAMPAENHAEELAILKREIALAKRLGYVVVGVGINTDAPIRHGLETVRVDSAADVHLVVEELRKRLA